MEPAGRILRSDLMRLPIALPGLLLLLVPIPAAAQADSIAESRAHYARAVEAYRAGDYQEFLEHAARAQRLRPLHGGVTYALAAARALTGDTAGAMEALHRFAAMGYAADPAADSDFASLSATAGFREVELRLRRNREPLVRSDVAFELPEPDLLAEGIAYDPQEGAFYVSAVHQRKIVRFTRDSRVEDFAALDRDGLWTPLGMRADPAHRALWVATVALPQMRGWTPSDSGRSALLRYDLDTGKLTGRYPAPADGRPHAFGDVVVGGSGHVYVSDGRSPVIYRLAAGGESLVPLAESPLLGSAQGLALAPDQRSLYVADYARGVLRVDLEHGRVEALAAPDTVAALGIDGLYQLDGALIGIQNGVAPARIVRLELGPEGDRIERLEVLERAHPRHEEPTLGVLVGRELYYVANSQWERFGSDGRPAHPERLRRPVVLRLRL